MRVLLANQNRGNILNDINLNVTCVVQDMWVIRVDRPVDGRKRNTSSLNTIFGYHSVS